MADKSKPRTLAWLAELAFEKGADAAAHAFASLAPPEDVRPWAVVRAGQGRPALRTDIERADGISYESFNPAPWDQPYSILRVRFEPLPKKDFIYHGGEELLVPLAGAVQYHFFWSPGGRDPRPETLDTPLRPGSLIRIRPQLPHHTWAAGRERAEAWMIIRHFSDTAAAISLDAPFESPDLHPPPRRVTKQDLADPGRFALIAWGIAERIRLHRERANLRLAQLAHACEIDPSHLSRIENADTNVSLDTLVRIARCLRIGLADLVAPPSHAYETGSFPSKRGRGLRPQAVLSTVEPHLLHPVCWDAPAGWKGPIHTPAGRSSWIVLDGRVIFEAGTPELVEAGSVIHFRGPAPARLHAMEESRLLEIRYAGECPCGK